ncbi:MAG: hypothetical protein DMF03_10720 [Verrucomicrobia bacterium]|nr:MAG: hypothetical protein DMF03_10720 [Verrucomicrobiota bacterium]
MRARTKDCLRHFGKLKITLREFQLFRHEVYPRCPPLGRLAVCEAGNPHFCHVDRSGDIPRYSSRPRSALFLRPFELCNGASGVSDMSG